jgi:hypothetical protein
VPVRVAASTIVDVGINISILDWEQILDSSDGLHNIIYIFDLNLDPALSLKDSGRQLQDVL